MMLSNSVLSVLILIPGFSMFAPYLRLHVRACRVAEAVSSFHVIKPTECNISHSPQPLAVRALVAQIPAPLFPKDQEIAVPPIEHKRRCSGVKASKSRKKTSGNKKQLSPIEEPPVMMNFIAEGFGYSSAADDGVAPCVDDLQFSFWGSSSRGFEPD
jgi:hypothetical protein